MRVSSLVFIQQLLEAEVEKEKKAVEKVKTLLAEKEDAAGVQWNTPDSKVNGNIQALRSMKETQRKYERRGLTAEGAGREYWRVPYQDCIYRMYGEDDSRAWARFVIDAAVNK